MHSSLSMSQCGNNRSKRTSKRLFNIREQARVRNPGTQWSGLVKSRIYQRNFMDWLQMKINTSKYGAGLIAQR